VVGQLVFRFKFLSTSCTNELWYFLVSMNHKMFLQFPRLSESSATLGAQIFLLSILLPLSLLPWFLGFAGVIDVSLLRVISLPRDDSLMFEQHVVPVGQMIME
jgi:hypothetical protein